MVSLREHRSQPAIVKMPSNISGLPASANRQSRPKADRQLSDSLLKRDPLMESTMAKQCEKCKKPLRMLGVVFASVLQSSLRCRTCGELWGVIPARGWRNIAMAWGVITGSVSPFAAILLWSWWPILLSPALLFLLTCKAAGDGTLRKRFCLR